MLADEIVHGTVLVRDGLIADIASGNSRVGEDFGGDTLIPGCVELHTDHLETHIQPRPKVRWNLDAALQAHDGQIATSGITTVFDALRVGLEGDTEFGAGDMSEMADAIAAASAEGRLRAEHFIHLRCEVSVLDVVDHFDSLQDNPRVRLASLMDHAPGQRQFVSLEAYRIYYQGKKKLSDAEFAAYSERRVADSAANSDRNRRLLADRCVAAGIAMASHDDATPAHVEESVALGIAMAEFPTTIEAATLSREAGLQVLMGAPNVVRGGSHSGNVSALDLLNAGALDILSSDYVPFSLVQAAFLLPECADIDLPHAIRLISANPAAAAGLADRGRIAPGLRADLVRVQTQAGRPPRVAAVWRGGYRVA
ncbi:alpha-D-ribose 1-methylphosphonate 5-triphosphate diphosphatase [Methylobrevis pamukkalensis]|uniref:Alpha-D-ribose 1-methylphosphonate 5-triphosphate diphosphatase n=1 Tax=Methylobrevis pamukkalensis TaxID=1439726 RepID=A0A1E3H548_9HYPH|nr:alpha-D-ribose 1-methylphosphonate 5-triphosphate diphosphatase [Methylobrevis pamukkalensis]ODN70621.1 Alpha-D-ribose 1-methylphosphonate 5-triphosphate diphosphatase [Methylobrevis pamukkalensis]